MFVEFPDSTGNNADHYRYWHYSVGVPFGNGPTFTQFDESNRRALHVPLQPSCPSWAAGTAWTTWPTA